MSNGDDVLDNWEEIDEEELQSTVSKLNTSSASLDCESITIAPSQDTTTNSENCSATATTSSSPRAPTEMKLLQRSSTTQDSTTTSMSSTSSSVKSPLENISATFQPVLMVLHKPQDEYQSANYTPPIANQTVKILRRPSQTTEPRNNDIRPKQPIKTLKQREQEYAEARLRILGSAKNPEDEEKKTSTTSTTLITTSTTNSTPSTPATTLAALTSNSITNMVATPKLQSPKVQGGGGVSIAANQYNNLYNQQLQQQQLYQQNYQQQQQNCYYNQQQLQQQQHQQQPQSPTYNNNRTYNMNPLLGLGPMGAIGQPAQYQPPAQTHQQQHQQQHLKYPQYHQKSPLQQHKSQQQQQHQKQKQTWSPVVGGSVSSSSIRQQQNDPIIRSPRGPDGSTGFQTRR